MKILIATPKYHPHIGGVEYVVKSVAERLAVAYPLVKLTPSLWMLLVIVSKKYVEPSPKTEKQE